MYKKITSTQLKQNTRKVINEVILNPDKPTIVFSYNEPRIVLLDYQSWRNEQIKAKRPSLNELQDYFIRTKKRIDSSKIISRMRDEK